MAKLVYAHHTLGLLVGVSDELAIIEHSPGRYAVLSSNSLQDATYTQADHEIKLDLLNVLHRARFLGMSDEHVLDILSGLMGEQ